MITQIRHLTPIILMELTATWRGRIQRAEEVAVIKENKTFISGSQQVETPQLSIMSANIILSKKQIPIPSFYHAIWSFGSPCDNSWHH